MTMTTGVKWNEDYANPKSDVSQAGFAPWKGGANAASACRSSSAKPHRGTKWVYKTGETDLAGIALGNALAGKGLAKYASEKLWAPYGMEQDAIWMVDKAGHERGGCCMSMTLRDYARIGLFMLGGGEIDGKKILPEGWVDDATANHVPAKQAAEGAAYGYFWWPMPEGYRAAGIFGQGTLRLPGRELGHRRQRRPW